MQLNELARFATENEFSYELLAVSIATNPQCSLRSMECCSSQMDMKLSVSMQATSVKRLVSAFACHNGPALGAFVSDVERAMNEFVAPMQVTLMREKASARMSNELACVLRAGLASSPEEKFMPLAFLLDRPFASETETTSFHLSHYLDEANVRKYVELFISAFVFTLCVRRVSMECHCQNTLVHVRNGQVVGLAYRDLGGIKVTEK